jgi:hypothetical protein
MWPVMGNAPIPIDGHMSGVLIEVIGLSRVSMVMSE